MKKVLGILLALTLTVGAFAGLTLLSVSAASQTALVEGKSLTEDFEGNTNQYINAPLGGTVEVQSAGDGAQVHGGEYSLKFSGGNGTWTMPAISGDATKQVVNGKDGTYQFHAWVYFEIMPTSGEDTLSLLFRGTQGTIDPERDHVQFNSANGTSIAVQANQWIELTYTYTLSLTQAADENLYVCMDNMGTESVLYLDDISFTKLEEDPDDTPKKVENGDAENGLTGWGVFAGAGGEAPTLVEPGANGTAHAVRFNPTAQWDSIAFDLGPAIIQNQEAGYNGMGAGKYMVTFWAKVDGTVPANTKFEVLLNSQLHTTKPEELAEYGVTVQDYHEKTFINGAYINLTGEWAQYSVVFDVSENFLRTLDDLYAAGNVSAYEVVLRLDGGNVGAECAYVGGSVFPYLVDEVTIGSAKDPVGVQWTINKDVTGSIFISSDKAKGFITADDVKNGKVQKSFTVYNTGEHAIQVQFSASVLHQGTPESWEAVKNTEWYTIPAGQSQLITYECDAKVTINTKGLEKEYSYDQFFPRFDIKAEGDTVKAGTSFIVAGISPEVLMQLDSSNAKESMTVSMVYELPTNSRPGGDLLPVALIAAVVAAAVVLVVVAKKKKEQE